MKNKNSYSYTVVMVGTQSPIDGTVEFYRQTYETKQRATKAMINCQGLGYDAWIEREPKVETA